LIDFGLFASSFFFFLASSCRCFFSSGGWCGCFSRYVQGVFGVVMIVVVVVVWCGVVKMEV